MKNLGCLLPYSSQNVTEALQIVRRSYFGQRKNSKIRLLTFLDLTLTVFMLLSEESLGGSKNPK